MILPLWFTVSSRLLEDILAGSKFLLTNAVELSEINVFRLKNGYNVAPSYQLLFYKANRSYLVQLQTKKLSVGKTTNESYCFEWIWIVASNARLVKESEQKREKGRRENSSRGFAR